MGKKINNSSGCTQQLWTTNRSNFRRAQVCEQQTYYICDTIGQADTNSKVAQQASCSNPVPNGVIVEDAYQPKFSIPSRTELKTAKINDGRSFLEHQSHERGQYYKLGHEWVYAKEGYQAQILKTDACGRQFWCRLNDEWSKKLENFKTRDIELEDELDAECGDNKTISDLLSFDSESVSGFGRVVFDSKDHSRPISVKQKENGTYVFQILDMDHCSGQLEWSEITESSHPKLFEALKKKYPDQAVTEEEKIETLPTSIDLSSLQNFATAANNIWRSLEENYSEKAFDEFANLSAETRNALEQGLEPNEQEPESVKTQKRSQTVAFEVEKKTIGFEEYLELVFNRYKEESKSNTNEGLILIPIKKNKKTFGIKQDGRIEPDSVGVQLAKLLEHSHNNLDETNAIKIESTIFKMIDLIKRHETASVGQNVLADLIYTNLDQIKTLNPTFTDYDRITKRLENCGIKRTEENISSKNSRPE